MQYDKSAKPKRGAAIFVTVLAVFGFLLTQAEAASRDTVVAVVALLILITPPALVIWLVVFLAKKNRPAAHTHDRIDHRSDLKVDARTGKTQRVTVRMEQHTPQEHWKQQLDGLLANGTIDRAEYRALLNHRF